MNVHRRSTIHATIRWASLDAKGRIAMGVAGDVANACRRHARRLKPPIIDIVARRRAAISDATKGAQPLATVPRRNGGRLYFPHTRRLSTFDRTARDSCGT
jgi:hypothetical protein